MNETSRCSLELAILRALIFLGEDGRAGSANAKLTTALQALQDHPWNDEENRVVYESLRRASRRSGVPLREEMAAEAVRMGHPDADWDLYFRPPSEQLDLLQAIRGLSKTA
jgi:hypothetical protein